MQLKSKVFPFIALGLLLFAATGCEKNLDDEPIETNGLSTIEAETVKISELKSYLASMLGADTSDIQFSTKSKMFSMFGHDQVHQTDLIILYNENKK